MNKLKKMVSFLVPLTFMVFFSGCVASNTPKPQNIGKIELKDDEQIVYFIREDTFNGGAYDSFVECNNKRFLLKYGEYTYCKIRKGTNTISHGKYTLGLFLVSPILKSEYTYASSYMTHDLSNEKELYMFLGRKIGKGIDISKITKDEALEYLKNGDYDFRSPVDNGVNGNNHLIALFNPTTLFAYDSKFNKLKIKSETLDNHQLKMEIEQEFQILKKQSIEKKEQMKMVDIPLEDDSVLKRRAEENVVASKGEIYKTNFFLGKNGINFISAYENNNQELDKNKSRILIYRESDNGNAFAEVWTKDGYLGGLLRNTYLEFETDQNDLTLFTNYGKLEFIDLKLEKGKTYFIRVDSSIGRGINPIQLLNSLADSIEQLNNLEWSINSIQLINSTEDEFNKQKLQQLHIDYEKIPSNYRIRINEALKLIDSKDFFKDENTNLSK